MKLMNSSLRPHILSEILIGIRAKRTSSRRIHLIAVLKRLMSFWCLATSLVGKRLVQNLSPLPKETCKSTLRCQSASTGDCS